MKIKTLLLGWGCALALSACGSDSPKSSTKSATYHYNFNVTSCSPSVFKGRFRSQLEMCQALSYQAQLHPCAASHILREFEAQNCHQGDFLHTGNLPYSPGPGVFYNENNEPYILTPQGPILLEKPDLYDEPIRTAYDQAEAELEDDLICEHGVCRTLGERLDIIDGKVYINGYLALDPNLTDEDIYGPNHFDYPGRVQNNASGGQNSTGGGHSTLVRPEPQQPAPPRREQPTPAPTPAPHETAGTPQSPPQHASAEVNTPESEEIAANIPLPIPRPVPRPSDLSGAAEEPTRPSDEGTVSTEETARPSDTESVTTRPETETTTPTPTPSVETQTEDPAEVSDVSEATEPQTLNLIYFTTTGAMYTEIPNPQNQQRFPILRITAKIDSRSPLHNNKHSNPIRELDVNILNSETTVTCRPLAQISSNNDIVVLTLKTKEQTDVAQLQACKDWFQVIRRSNFEFQTPELQTESGLITGQFHFILSE